MAERVLLTVGAIVFLGVCFWGMFRAFKSEMERRKKALEMFDADPCENDQPIAVHAQVLSMRIDGYYEGSTRSPQYTTEFLITFMTDDEATVEYAVPKEVFDRTQVNQSGMLLTLNDAFFDFGDGEDVE